jgi:elongation factor 3
VAGQFKEAGGKAPETVAQFIITMAMALIDNRSFVDEEWLGALTVPYLSAHMAEPDAKAVGAAFVDSCRKEDERQEAELHKGDEEEGEDLCKCEFSLAYGAKILLNNTYLHLKRGKRYGLCGPNGCGKSTLMRAIANGQVEGFPPPEVLKTVYVEHDLDDSEVELTVADYLTHWFQEKEPAMGVTKDSIVEQLTAVGFSDELQNRAVGALSGGWKMKLALSRAILMKADILLLDEPTNHLDVSNVKWLMDYLCSMTSISSMIVSHDSGFLETVCTHIIHYENRKLKAYRGNLTEFVKQVPEAASYYSLEASTVTWNFPEPGYLEGVKTKDKAILKMTNMSFTYPGAEKPQLTDVNVQVRASSRRQRSTPPSLLTHLWPVRQCSNAASARCRCLCLHVWAASAATAQASRR